MQSAVRKILGRRAVVQIDVAEAARLECERNNAEQQRLEAERAAALAPKAKAPKVLKTTTKAPNPKAQRSRKAPATPFVFFCKDRRKEVAREDLTHEEVTAQLRVAWKALTHDEKRPYYDAANEDRKAFGLAPIGESFGLPGWQMQLLPNKKVAYVHVSGAVTMSKPKNLRRINAASERGLSDYCAFVKANFAKHGSLKAVAAEWRKAKGQQDQPLPTGNASNAAESPEV